MKSLKQYILEEFKEFRVKDLEVNYFTSIADFANI